MAVRAWNADGRIATVGVLDAIVVVVPKVDPEPVDAAVPPAVDPEPTLDGMAAVCMWSGFESFVLDDAGLLEALDLDYPGTGIPSWAMTELDPLAAKGEITINEFVTALVYVLLEGA